MSPKSVLVYALVLLTATPRLVAQQHEEANEVWRTYAERVPPGALVSVRLKNGPALKGHVIQVTSDAVRLNLKKRLPVPDREVRFADIESITSVKEGKSPGQKVLVGAAIGGAIVVAAFLLAVASISN